MREKHNCLALPVHDSFIVESSKESTLKDEMATASSKITGISIDIDRK